MTEHLTQLVRTALTPYQDNLRSWPLIQNYITQIKYFVLKTQPAIQRVPGFISPGVKLDWCVTLINHPHLVPRSSRSYTSPLNASMACSGTALLFKQYLW
jgi:hypothetical protein